MVADRCIKAFIVSNSILVHSVFASSRLFIQLLSLPLDLDLIDFHPQHTHSHGITCKQLNWMNTRVGYDGDVCYVIALNLFVHVVMYAYYECTTLYIPVPTPNKKLVTNIQMIQFVTMITQGICIVTFKCPYITGTRILGNSAVCGVAVVHINTRVIGCAWNVMEHACERRPFDQ
jgi:hypothetical protein